MCYNDGMNTKRFYKSRTLYYSGTLIALALALLSSDELSGWVATLPPDTQGWVLLIIGTLSGLLRLITSDKLTIK